MNTLQNYDRWKTSAPDDDIWVCEWCDEENNGGDQCPECDVERATYCSNGRCQSCDGCLEKGDRDYDEARDREFDPPEDY